MKKNVLPLIVIALVVAVASTGIFYGLIVSRMDGSATPAPTPRLVSALALEKGHLVKESDFKLAPAPDPGVPAPAQAKDLVGRTLKEPIEAGKVFVDTMLTPLSERGVDGGIPAGMRAVTVHIADSSSVVRMIHPGDRVDVQAVVVRNRNGEPDVEVRTLLQNATVYNIPAEPTTPQNNPQMQGRNVLTLLSSPQDAERLSAADAGARLRVVLRNRADQTIVPLAATSLLNLGGAPRPVVTSSFAPGAPVAKPAVVRTPVELEVRLIEVSSDLARQISPELSKETLAVASSSAQQDLPAKLEEWKQSQKAHVLASGRVVAGRAGEFSWKPSEQSSLRVRIEPLGQTADGIASLRIQPETTLPVAGVATTRRADSSISFSKQQGAIVTGLLPGDQVAQLREKLAPGQKGAGGELLMVITAVTRN